MYFSDYSQSAIPGESNFYPEATLHPYNIPDIGEIFLQFYIPLQKATQLIVRVPADAEDIAMAVIYKVSRAKTKPKSNDHLRNRLFVVARNEAIDLVRHRSQQKKIASDLVFGQYSADLLLPITYPSEPQLNWHQLLSAEIKRLAPQRQKILLMYFYGGMSTRQIANQLNLSSQTVLNHKAGALQVLRDSQLKYVWRRGRQEI